MQGSRNKTTGTGGTVLEGRLRGTGQVLTKALRKASLGVAMAGEDAERGTTMGKLAPMRKHSSSQLLRTGSPIMTCSVQESQQSSSLQKNTPIYQQMQHVQRIQQQPVSQQNHDYQQPNQVLQQSSTQLANKMRSRTLLQQAAALQAKSGAKRSLPSRSRQMMAAERLSAGTQPKLGHMQRRAVLSKRSSSSKPSEIHAVLGTHLKRSAVSEVDLRVVFLIDVSSLQAWTPEAIFHTIELLQRGHQAQSKKMVWGHRLFDSRSGIGCTPRELDRAFGHSVRSTQFFSVWDAKHRRKLCTRLVSDTKNFKRWEEERLGQSHQILGSSTLSHFSIFQSSVAEILVDFNWDDTESQIPGKAIDSLLYVISPCPVNCETAYQDFSVKPNALDFLQKYNKSRALRLCWVDALKLCSNDDLAISRSPCCEVSCTTKVGKGDSHSEISFQRKAFEQVLRRVDGCMFALSAPATAIVAFGISDIAIKAFLGAQWMKAISIERRSRPVSPQMQQGSPGNTLQSNISLPYDLGGWEGDLLSFDGEELRLPLSFSGDNKAYIVSGQLQVRSDGLVELSDKKQIPSSECYASSFSVRENEDSIRFGDSLKMVGQLSLNLLSAQSLANINWICKSDDVRFVQLLCALRASKSVLVCTGPEPSDMLLALNPLYSGSCALVTPFKTPESSLLDGLTKFSMRPTPVEPINWSSQTNGDLLNSLSSSKSDLLGSIIVEPFRNKENIPVRDTISLAQSTKAYRSAFEKFMAPESPLNVTTASKNMLKAEGKGVVEPAPSQLSKLPSQNESQQLTAVDDVVEDECTTLSATTLAEFAPKAIEILQRGSCRQPIRDPVAKPKFKSICKALTRARFSAGAQFAEMIQQSVVQPFQDSLPRTVAEILAHFDLDKESILSASFADFNGAVKSEEQTKDDSVEEEKSEADHNSQTVALPVIMSAEKKSHLAKNVPRIEPTKPQQHQVSKSEAANLVNPFRVELVSHTNLIHGGNLTVQKRRFALNHFSGAMSNPERLLKQRRVARSNTAVTKPLVVPVSQQFSQQMGSSSQGYGVSASLKFKQSSVSLGQSKQQTGNSTKVNTSVSATPDRKQRDKGIIMNKPVIPRAVIEATPCKPIADETRLDLSHMRKGFQKFGAHDSRTRKEESVIDSQRAVEATPSKPPQASGAFSQREFVIEASPGEASVKCSPFPVLHQSNVEPPASTNFALTSSSIDVTPRKSAFESPQGVTPPRGSKKRLFGSPHVIEASPLQSYKGMGYVRECDEENLSPPPRDASYSTPTKSRKRISY